MIKEMKSLSMVEVRKIVETSEENKELVAFIKKFIKLKEKQVNEFRKKLEELDLMKMKPEHIAKIIDLMPENGEELNKIFIDIGLNEDETKKILETTKEFK